MILPDCRIIYHENEHSDYSGIDCEQYCTDKNHFKNYPHVVTYNYNSRGFRGPEWPQSTANAIWCVGDSFTAGLGAPENHTWWHKLSEAVKRPCINVSMDGASNAWISRWAQKIIHQTQAKTLVVHWSFTHRRERALKQIQDQIWQKFYSAVKDAEWPDCASWWDIDKLPESIQKDLRQDPRTNCYTQGFDLESLAKLHSANTTVEQDIEHTVEAVQNLEKNKNGCQVIHSHIPKWHPTQLQIDTGTWVKEFDQVDFARDGLHYDIKTAELLVNRILQVLEV